jgi:hypothetical protein
VPPVEGGRPFTVADRERDVIQRHRRIIASVPLAAGLEGESPRASDRLKRLRLCRTLSG